MEAMWIQLAIGAGTILLTVGSVYGVIKTTLNGLSEQFKQLREQVNKVEVKIDSHIVYHAERK